jgi:hypothetical protein
LSNESGLSSFWEKPKDVSIVNAMKILRLFIEIGFTIFPIIVSKMFFFSLFIFSPFDLAKRQKPKCWAKAQVYCAPEAAHVSFFYPFNFADTAVGRFRGWLGS